VLLEIVALFGPATLFLFLGPIGAVAFFANPSGESALLVTTVVLGFWGLFTVLHLAAHVLDSEHRLPSRKALLFGIGAGVVACTLAMWVVRDTPWMIAVFFGPVIGAAHLLYLSRTHNVAF